MNLTIYPGTFNPIHVAHLIIAETVKDELGVDKILFIPSYIPPHRDKSLADPAHRLNMVKLSIKDNTYFDVSDIEFNNEDKSYSYYTVNKLYDLHPNITDKINFIIGSDAFNLIDSWYRIEELAKIVRFIIVARPDIPDIELLFSNIKLKSFEYRVVKTPLIEISSSYIRERIKDKKSVKYLVYPPVEDYIKKNRLYLD